ncbi:GNAT family N-acetyltransferase [Murinocardiopsis flavida]|nr:GNAT family N-acetyltransferase [Murinocardiopsis flavida]
MSQNGTARTARCAPELVRLDTGSERAAGLRAAVVRLRLGPGRHFADPAHETLPRADADPNRVPFAVVNEGEAVGFGILDRRGNLAELTPHPERAVLLRAFYIDPARQGLGLGRAACNALDPIARDVAPDADTVLLTVNERNPAAIRAYLAGGFDYTGDRYLNGDMGPQFVLRRPIAR